MINNKQVWVSGFLATGIYLICTTFAFFNYPEQYSPFANWLSDLGNPIINPTGAFFYNMGCVIAGLCIIFFSLGFEIWAGGDKRRRIILTIAQVTGIISSLCLIVSAFFPLGAQTLIHSISGKAHIFFAGFFLTFSATFILRHISMSKWLAYFGFLAALINFIYGAFLHEVFIAEWAAIGSFIIYVLMISGFALKQNLRRAEIGVSNS